MLTEWTSCGFSPEDFWKQTFRTYEAVMDGATKRNYQSHNTAVKTAYLTILFMRSDNPDPQKHMVDLKTGEALNNAGSQLPAQEALESWWMLISALNKKQKDPK